MAKEGTKLKPSMQIEWYCPAVHKNACKRTLEYTGVKKQITDSIFFFLSFFLSFPSENIKDLGMTCHTPPLKKAKKQGEMPYPASVTSHP